MTHAIVIGSSIAGLTAARVLSNHFDKVTLIDRDTLPETPEFRKGVPQARHAHALLRRGLDILEQHFPGLTQDLMAQDSVVVNFGQSFRYQIFGQWRKRYTSKVESVACSRPLLELTAYRHLTKNPCIQVIQDTEVVGLCIDDSGTRATGVQLKTRSGENGREKFYSLDADLIIDTSGRASRAPEWLEEAGYTAPEETEVSSQAAYASRFYELPAEYEADWNIMLMQPTAPDYPRGALIMPMEGRKWNVVLIGVKGDYPPTDHEGWMEFARSLPSPAFVEAVEKAIPVGPIYGYRRTENRLRHYNKLPRYLEHFLVMGDSVCSFNPMYGQGMTVASMESLKLDECLAAHRKTHAPNDFTGLAQEFQKQVAAVVAGPWQLASGEDRRWMSDETPDMPTRFIQWYVNNVLQASLHNPVVTEAFYRVQNMLAEPTSLFNPKVMLNVLATRLKHRN